MTMEKKIGCNEVMIVEKSKVEMNVCPKNALFGGYRMTLC